MDSGWLVLLSYGKGILSFLIMIVVLVGVHELGHFWFARMFGMHVNAFAIMMGGIRKTDLSSRLVKPLASGMVVGAIATMAGALTIAGGILSIPVLFQVGLFAISIVIPIWIVSRLQALYQLSNGGAYRTLATAWGIGLLFLVFATRMKGVTVPTVLSIIFFASLLALVFVYYTPVLAKEESSEQGYGELKYGGETVQVRFRPIWFRTDRHGTEFSLLALPLGGFASIKGMEPKDDGSEVNEDRGFYSKSPAARFWVLFAGPLFSIVLGIVILTGVLMASGKPVEEARLGEILPGKPASVAGIKSGDEVVAINGKPVKKWFDMIAGVRDSAGKPLQFVVRRDGAEQTLTVIPTLGTEKTPVLNEKLEPSGEMKLQGQIGARRAMSPIPFPEALGRASTAPWTMVKGLASVVAKPSTAKDQLGGPASIAQATHDAANEGLLPLISMAGLLSISLGVMNLLPIPPLDGGQIVVAIAEMLRGGKRLSMGVQRVVQSIGFFFIIGLMGLVIFLDISRNVTGK